MKRTQRIALALLAVGAIGVFWLMRHSRQPPLLPRDETHASWESAAACDGCHGPAGAVPRSAKHPLGFDCLRCHGNG